MRLFSIITAAAIVSFAIPAVAQLPTNPFNNSENDGVFTDVNTAASKKESVTTAPMYSSGVTGGEVLPVDPWAKARDRSGVETWRGSGQHGRLDYIGEATTYTDAQGQEMIAPEVNRHNAVVGLAHLRKLGYKIPDSYDERVKNAPAAYKNLLTKRVSEVHSGDDPFSRSVTKMMKLVEEYTGLDLNNILFNSLRLLSID